MGFVSPVVAIASAAVGAVGSIAGGLIGKSGTSSAANQSYLAALETNKANKEIANQTNQTNIKLQRETNAANLSLAEKQNQWNIEQWNRENQYNSPANQMKLYREAGLNPVLAQGSFSPATQLQSAELANQIAPQATAVPTMQNPMEGAAQIKGQGSQMFGSSVSSAVNQATSTIESLARFRKTLAEEGYTRTMTDADYKKTMAEFYKLNNENKWFDKLSDAEWKVKIEQANSLRATAALHDSVREKTEVDKALADFDLHLKLKTQNYLEKMPMAELGRMVAEARNLNANAAISELEKKRGSRLPSPSSGIDQFLSAMFNYFVANGKINSIFDAIDGAISDLYNAAKDVHEFNKDPLGSVLPETAPIGKTKAKALEELKDSLNATGIGWLGIGMMHP